MEQELSKDLLEYDDQGNAKLPTGLNVLTILTFIGCSLLGLAALAAPFLYDLGLKMMDKAQKSGKEFSAKELEEMAKRREEIEFGMQHMVPAMIIGIVGIALCFLGALWMRKFKKDGYLLYVIGELMPIAATMAIIGTKQYQSVSGIIAGIALPVLFVILYTTQRKYLTR
ncbi:hypothetical protein [Ferruginibacter sp.]